MDVYCYKATQFTISGTILILRRVSNLSREDGNPYSNQWISQRNISKKAINKIKIVKYFKKSEKGKYISRKTEGTNNKMMNLNTKTDGIQIGNIQILYYCWTL